MGRLVVSAQVTLDGVHPMPKYVASRTLRMRLIGARTFPSDVVLLSYRPVAG